MSGIEVKPTNLFQAKDEEGNIYWIQEFTEFRETTTLSSRRREWTEGMKSYRLRENGSAVNLNGPDEYKVVQSGVILTTLK